MKGITIEQYAALLNGATHHVSGVRPTASDFFDRMTRITDPSERKRASVVGHNLSVHGWFSEAPPPGDCDAKCKKKGIQPVVEGRRLSHW